MHGFRLVLLEETGAGALQRAPTRGQPASREIAEPQRHDNVVSIRSTTQLVPKLIGGKDPYVENVLSKVPNITPGMMGDHFLPGLLPAEEDLAANSELELATVHPVNETVPDDGEVRDGGASRSSRRNKDLAGSGGDAA